MAWALEVAGRPEESLAALNAGMLFAGFDHFVKAIVLVRLGRAGEASTEVKKGLEINPAMTQMKWREINFYSDPAILDSEVADLAKRGCRRRSDKGQSATLLAADVVGKDSKRGPAQLASSARLMMASQS